jgi:hypothetical protein
LSLDGRLDDEVYSTVPPISDFIQLEPMAGQPATEQTEAWIFFDDENFYVSARLWDSRPEQMVINEFRRDAQGIVDNESFAIVVDTFYDRRNGYGFQTNPLGALRDQTVTNEGTTNIDWNTVWDAHSSVFEGGWMTEMVIPFKSVRYEGSGPQVWSINLRRIVKWKNEISFNVPMPPVFGMGAIYRLSLAPSLVIETPPRSMNVELKPYGISSITTDRAAATPFSNDLKGDFGVDLKYGVTQGLTADLTYNTDFAQVEADEQQVNLTRFNLQFPEKREFFLEGVGIFSFGGVGLNAQGSATTAPILFFSRSIGVSRGRAVPIQAGGRLTGKAGKFTLGALNIQTSDSPTVGARETNFSVVRVKRDVLRRSYVGVIATRRAPAAGSPDQNVTLGLDAGFSFFRNVNFNTYYARTDTPGRTGDQSSYRAQFDYGSDRYGLQVDHVLVGESFNPEMGFLRRTNFRRNYAQARFSPRPRSSRVVRKYYAVGNIDYTTDAAGDRLETREIEGTFDIEFQSGDRLSLGHTRTYDFLPSSFAIATGVTIPVGGYHFSTSSAALTLVQKRRVGGSVNVATGSFYNGHRTDAGFSGTVQVRRGIAVQPRLSWNWVDLPYGRFTAKLVSTRTSVSFSTRMSVGALVQYNSSTNAFDVNVRYRWEYRPGSDFYVVYSEGRKTGLETLPALETRGLVVKLTRLLRF